MKLPGIDLNLLVIFDALYTDRSVATAARRVGLSPSGLSHSLARLRQLFDDPLFQRSGTKMVPTPRAEQLAPPIRAALGHVRDALDETAPFDPTTSRQTFRVSASDPLQVMLLPALLDAAEAVAPAVRVEAIEIPRRKEASQALARGELDLAIGGFSHQPNALHRVLLFATRVVCLARRDHPRVQEKISLEQYLAEGHVHVEGGDPAEFPHSLDEMLRSQGYDRRVVSSVGSLQVAPLVVAQSDLLCGAAEDVVSGIAERLGLQILEHPLDLPRHPIHAVWHERTHRSAAHRWFRGLLRETVDTLLAGTAGRRGPGGRALDDTSLD